MTKFFANEIAPERITFALSYPFIRPDGDFIYINGVSYRVTDRTGHQISNWKIQTGNIIRRISEITEDVPDFSKMTPVIAAGSNGAPLQLNRKFSKLNNVLIPCLNIEVKDFTPCYLKSVTSYGSIPASLQHTPGTTAILPITFLDDATLQHMNETEGLGHYYKLIDVPNVDFASHNLIDFKNCYAYQGMMPHLDMALDIFNVENCPFAQISQWDAQEEIIKILELDVAVGQFIWENLTDPTLRGARNKLLRQVV